MLKWRQPIPYLHSPHETGQAVRPGHRNVHQHVVAGSSMFKCSDCCHSQTEAWPRSCPFCCMPCLIMGSSSISACTFCQEGCSPSKRQMVRTLCYAAQQMAKNVVDAEVFIHGIPWTGGQIGGGRHSRVQQKGQTLLMLCPASNPFQKHSIPPRMVVEEAWRGTAGRHLAVGPMGWAMGIADVQLRLCNWYPT